MTDQTNIPQESSIVGPVSEQTTDLVKAEMPNATEEVIKETAALFEAIKKRVQIEMQTATELTRETYQKAVTQAQQNIEQNQATVKERMDEAVKLFQQEVDKNLLVVDAIKTRAQAEVQTAGEVSRDAYLKAVREARTVVEENQLIDRNRIEEAVAQIQKQAEDNWHGILTEINSINTRLTESAKSAWNALIASLPKSDKD
jgi:BMFP domain-containing protein YqiC